jgi:hypothetical protein
MTSNEVERREPGTQLAAIPHTSPELDRVARLGMWLAAVESGSKDPKALGMGAALRIAYAESIGLPAHAASEVHVIKGNLTISAKLCRALGKPHGITVEALDASDQACTAVVYEHGQELGRRTFTLEMARRRGLLDKPGDTWKKIPDRMLWARASKMALDDLAPWVTVGVLSHEQAQEVSDDVEVIEPEPFEEDDE